MQHNHPTSWRILKANPKPNSRRSSEYYLPTPKGEDPLVISTFAANAILRHHHGKSLIKPSTAGGFATACEALIARAVNLTSLSNISPDAETTVREWLHIYKKACRDHGKGEMLEDSPTDITKVEEFIEPIETCPAYDQIVVAAVAGFAMHSGPMVDAKIVAERAKAVADAYQEISNAKPKPK